MKRVIAAMLLLLAGTACREAAQASGDAKDPNVAICAAAHGVPHVLLAYHQQRITMKRAMSLLRNVRREIDENASGAHAQQLRDVAVAIRIFELVTKNRGDTSDAYRDLRTLREALPPCRSA